MTATPEDIYEGCLRIQQLVDTNPATPFFIGRNGTIEIETLYFWLVNRTGSAKSRPAPYPHRMLRTMEFNAGVFPGTDESLDLWAEEYVKALGLLDGMAAGWYTPLRRFEEILLDRYTPRSSFRFPLRSLEPFYSPSDFQWSKSLSGKRVAVVSSFAETIERQIARKAPIWTGSNAGLLPENVKWSFFRTGYAPGLARGSAEWPRAPRSWQEALVELSQRILLSKPDVALIGCGGLGMILAGILRTEGISCIVLGGAIQVLFGIKGDRWSSHPIISKLWNDAWVWPAASETPAGAVLIERGCYWGSASTLPGQTQENPLSSPTNEDPSCERSSPGGSSEPNV